MKIRSKEQEDTQQTEMPSQKHWCVEGPLHSLLEQHPQSHKQSESPLEPCSLELHHYTWVSASPCAPGGEGCSLYKQWKKTNHCLAPQVSWENADSYWKRTLLGFIGLWMPSDQAELACRIRDVPLLPHLGVWSRSSPRFEMSVPVEQLGSFHKLRRISFSSIRPFYWERSVSVWNKGGRKTSMQFVNLKTKIFHWEWEAKISKLESNLDAAEGRFDLP